MKVTIPEHDGDITLGMYQKYTELQSKEGLSTFEFNKRKVSIFTNVKYKDLNNISTRIFNELVKDIDIALNKEVEFKKFFNINGVEFGFIPNLDKISTKEHIDTSLYPIGNIETYHNLMAILFRPVMSKDAFGNYEIIKYEGTEKYAEIMKEVPLNIVKGVLVFFCDLSKNLEKSIQNYMVQEVKKEV